LAEIAAPRLVTIIDRDPARRKGFERAFHEIARVQHAYRGEAGAAQWVRPDGTLRSLPESEQPLIVFRHFRDQSIALDHGTTEGTVYYGGSGGDDADCPKEAVERIWRPVRSESGCLTPGEAADLLAYFSHAFEDGRWDVKPLVLRILSLDYLNATAVLCQGYLAAHAVELLGNKELKDVLKTMGWRDDFQRLLRNTDDPAGRKLTVSSTAWWSKVLAGPTATLIERLAQEWGNQDRYPRFDDLKALVSTLQHDQIITCEIVARAYAALAARLNGERGGGMSEGWQRRRSAFNHDWLKNKFMPALATCHNGLKGHVEYEGLERTILEQVIPEWVAHRVEAISLLADFEREMSPKVLVDRPPLVTACPHVREWLGDLVHNLWLARYPIRDLRAAAGAAAAEADTLSDRLRVLLEPIESGQGPVSTTVRLGF
jgi:hypothetical protein